MAFLVEVEHQSRKGFQGIGYGAMIVFEQPAMGCPYGQTALQLLVAGFDEPTEFDERRSATGFLPLLAGNGEDGCAMPVAHTGKGGYSFHVASFPPLRRAAKRR